MTLRTTWAADARLAAHWWAAVRPAIPAEVRGLWFGLLEPDPDDVDARWDAGAGRPTLCLTGTGRFDADDPDAGWTADRVWSPPGPDPLPSLATAGPREALAVVEAVVRHVLDPGRLPLRVEGVAAGWDDGEAVMLWTRRAGWWRRGS